MSARIRTTLYEFPAGPVVGPVLDETSRDDLRKGYQVIAASLDAATTYSWQLSFTPQSTGGGIDPLEGTASVAALLAPEGSTSSTARFNIDNEGAYLLRLVVDAGLPTESVQFIRMRYLTQFGDLKLVSAGERRDQNGVIPVDASAQGWSNDQNRNLQRLALFIRRVATSGRCLYVDHNKGRDSTLAANDPDNLVDFPGWDSTNLVGTGLQTGAEAFGDFSTISGAINYAAAAAGRGEPVPSLTDPYFIFVQPGLYEEDLTLQSHIHVIGYGPTPGIADVPQVNAAADRDNLSKRNVIVRTANFGGATHSYSPAGPPTTDAVLLENLYLENTAAVTEPVLKHEGGFLYLRDVAIYQQGNGAGQGAALTSATADIAVRPAIQADNCSFFSLADIDADRWVVTLDAPKAVYRFTSCTLLGIGGGLEFNPTIYGGLAILDPQDADLVMTDCTITARGVASYALRAYGTTQSFTRCRFEAVDTTKAFSVDPFGAGAGAHAGDVSVTLDSSTVLGDVVFETAGATLTTTFTFGTTTMTGALSLPDGVPTTMSAGAHGKSLGYQNDYPNPVTGADVLPVLSRLGVNNVQDAIDLLIQLLLPLGGVPHLSLESAYNGLSSLNPPVVGGGLGKSILADDGAVAITGAAAPVDFLSALPAPTYNGSLKLEGILDVGPLVTDGQGSEFSVDPNVFVGGPIIRMGRAVYADDAGVVHRGINSATLIGGSEANTHRYNIRMRTRDDSTSGTGTMGHMILEAGSSLTPVGGGASPDAGHTFVRAGDYSNAVAGGLPGNIFLVPGKSDAGDPHGMTRVTCPATATPTVLVAANPFVGGVTGLAFFATPNGYVSLSVGAADNAATVAAAISLLPGLLGSVGGGGEITITTVLTGTMADVHYIGDDQGGALNTALGELRVNSGAGLTLGTYPDSVGIFCAGNGLLGIDGFILGSPQLVRVYVEFADSPYTVPDNVDIVGVDTTNGVVEIYLPNTLLTGAREGRTLIINDEGGVADINPVEISAGGGFPFGSIDNYTHNTTGTGVVPPGLLGPYLLGAADSGTLLYCQGEVRALDTFAIVAPGLGYAPLDLISVDGGTGRPAILQVITVGGGGAITSIERVKPGNYSVDPPSPSTTTAVTGIGAGATITPGMATSVAWYQMP